MIACYKEDFTTTNYGFSFKLLIFIVFPHYFNSFLFLSDNFRQTLGQIYRFVYIHSAILFFHYNKY